MPGMMQIQKAMHIRLVRRSRMPGEYMICTVMFGNGAEIGMGQTITQTVLTTTLRARNLAPTVSIVAATGATSITTAFVWLVTAPLCLAASAPAFARAGHSDEKNKRTRAQEE